MIKIIIIGDSYVGKTSLFDSFFVNRYINTPYLSNGIDLRMKTVNIKEKPYTLQIWDIPEKADYKNITDIYYRGAQGIILMFDINNSESLDNIPKWLDKIENNIKNEYKLFLVANKCDYKFKKKFELRVMEVGEDVKLLLEKYKDMEYFEISVECDKNVGVILDRLVEGIVDSGLVMDRKIIDFNNNILSDDCC
jgi:small GTP-binding protein